MIIKIFDYGSSVPFKMKKTVLILVHFEIRIACNSQKVQVSSVNKPFAKRYKDHKEYKE